jgi:hypothetical protein
VLAANHDHVSRREERISFTLISDGQRRDELHVGFLQLKCDNIDGTVSEEKL